MLPPFCWTRGKVLLEQHKRLLPFYDVFDEQRYFAPARSQQVVELDGVRLAISICEDALERQELLAAATPIPSTQWKS